MRNGFPLILLAIGVCAWSSQAQAQCRTCGHPGPYGVYENLRSVPIFRGGSLEQIPQDPPPQAGASAVKTAKIPHLNLRRTATAPVPTSGNGDDRETLPAVPASSRRQIPREGDAPPVPAPSPSDPFRFKAEPRAVAPGEATPPAQVDEKTGLPPVDPVKGRIPKYRYSGSTYPYYFGRSYVNYPHYEQWHEPATDAARKNRKMRFLNTFFEPMMDFTHGVQVDENEAPKVPPATARK